VYAKGEYQNKLMDRILDKYEPDDVDESLAKSFME
jgi:hypothetical protein